MRPRLRQCSWVPTIGKAQDVLLDGHDIDDQVPEHPTVSALAAFAKALRSEAVCEAHHERGAGAPNRNHIYISGARTSSTAGSVSKSSIVAPPRKATSARNCGPRRSATLSIRFSDEWRASRPENLKFWNEENHRSPPHLRRPSARPKVTRAPPQAKRSLAMRANFSIRA